MEYFWWLYLATRLDAISGFMFFVAVTSGIIGAVVSIVLMASYDNSSWSLAVQNMQIQEREAVQDRWRKRLSRPRNVLVALMLVFGFLGAMTPTKQDAMFIAGGVGVIEATKAVAGSEIAKKSVAVIEHWLSEQLDEVKDSVKKEAKRAAE